MSKTTTKDRLTKKQRSELMARVKSKDTRAEKTVRSLIFKMGFRYRLHRKDLPGTPDLVFPSHRKVVFVHGCFWHGHDCAAGKNRPSSNKPYWSAKLRQNKRRDKNNLKALEAMNWKALIVWECTVMKTEYIAELMKTFLNDK